jgi:hypothetical protein
LFNNIFRITKDGDHQMTFRITKLKTVNQLVGKKLPTNKNGHAGRAVEVLLEQMGFPINKGHGPDIEQLGVEVKTRDIDAVSPQTVADMRPDMIKTTPYKQSHVYEKFQQQLRIYTKEDVIISAEIYDFSAPVIQDLIQHAYEYAQQQIIANDQLDRTEYKDHYGYFERVSKNRKSLSFRLSKDDMFKLERMTKSTYKNLFTEL